MIRTNTSNPCKFHETDHEPNFLREGKYGEAKTNQICTPWLEPINLVSPKVVPIAIHPQTSTLALDFTTGVLPSKAPTTPITTKATLASHHNNHRHPHHRLPYKAAANSGSTAPVAKAKADAATACTGLVLKCLLLKLIAETVVDFVLCFLRIVSVVGS
ncbi:hypothetical protein ES332_A04G150500v1 [Gossypium tomentosum]|uniref:Uncharacterized protein n=1 Tax=Gossypium tomentosum TaxID=34277 RepID=A0A5D2QZY4_GOSTO|nr:hypothetical protein ES332_A04G150500v1 [Gossypium tomentosum]